MKNKNIVRIVVAAFMLGFLSQAGATQVATAVGKIIMTEGHYAPSCRIVTHKENGTGTQKNFRIKDIADGHDDIAPVVMSALLANRDVIILYDPDPTTGTTGCGSEPQIQIINMY